MTDLIKLQDFQITITHGLDENGEAIFHIDIEGDLPYVYALGLLEAAKDNLQYHYELDEDEE